MPELPDIELYVVRLRERLTDSRWVKLAYHSPFTLRSYRPHPTEFEGRTVISIFRMGKRVVFEVEPEAYCAVHLMIAGRLCWKEGEATVSRTQGKMLVATWLFDRGTLTLMEASTRKRASITLFGSRHELDATRRQGIDVIACTASEFTAVLRKENRTLKRALTDPDWFDGIGNAYSDEILHSARLSPIRHTQSLLDDEAVRLGESCRSVLTHWTLRLQQANQHFPRRSEITAFRPDFAVHGRFGLPCPVCSAPVQRVVMAEHEWNYCARCQNEGRIIADRGLSRLLKDDRPKSIEELES